MLLNILLYQAKLSGLWNSHNLCRDQAEEMTWLIPFSIFHATRYQTMATLGRGGKVHVAICLKKGGSITNLRSREGQVEHGEVIIYCTSTHVMKDSSLCLGTIKIHCAVIVCTRETTQSFITPAADYPWYAMTNTQGDKINNRPSKTTQQNLGWGRKKNVEHLLNLGK